MAKESDTYVVRDPKHVIPRKDIKFYALQHDLSVAEAIAELVELGLEAAQVLKEYE